MEETGDACPQLGIVGRRDWEAEEAFELLDQHDPQGKVIEVGPLDDERLAEAFNRARALLLRSHAEGFGLPLIEALAAGIPVIACDLAVFQEIGGDIPELLHPDDEEAWLAALVNYASDDSTRRKRQIARMKGYVAPTWADHFALVEALLGSVALDDTRALRVAPMSRGRI